MWFFKEQLFDDVLTEFDSFVYLIERTNLEEDNKSPIYYIGKKTFFNKTKHKGKRIIIESNWWDYYGSSDWLNSDIEKYGKDNFKRTILHLCRTKGDAGYLEAKEQIERNVLHINENGYKLYYNKNILGRYTIEPEFYKIEDKLKNYFLSENIFGNNYNKKWITNGTENRLVLKNIAQELTTNDVWVYGRCEKHIQVNNGIENLFIPKSEYDENIHTIGWIKKYITNGLKDKLLPVHQIDDFLIYNKDYYRGYSKNDNDIWINDGVTEKKIKSYDIENYKTFKVGRLHKNNYKNKVIMYKNNKVKWIFDYELEKYIQDGWINQGFLKGATLFFVTNGVEQKHFRNEKEKNIFLEKNKDWKDGQFKRENFNTKNKVIAKKVENDEKVIVTLDEYKINPYLVGVKTKKVKIKKNNRIIFTGYLRVFLFENKQYPELLFKNALRSETGDIFKEKGKNTWINEEKLNIRWL